VAHAFVCIYCNAVSVAVRNREGDRGRDRDNPSY